MGCKEKFEGEFVEKGKEVKNADAYTIVEAEGMKVFVPRDMTKFDKIELSSEFSLFKALVLAVDVY